MNLVRALLACVHLLKVSACEKLVACWDKRVICISGLTTGLTQPVRNLFISVKALCELYWKVAFTIYIFCTLALMELCTHLVHSLVLYVQSLAKASSRHTLCWFVVALLHLQSDAGSSIAPPLVMDSWPDSNHLYRLGSLLVQHWHPMLRSCTSQQSVLYVRQLFHQSDHQKSSKLMLECPAKRPLCLSGTAVSDLRSAEGSSTASTTVLDSWLGPDNHYHPRSVLVQHWQGRPCCCTSQESVLCFHQLCHQPNHQKSSQLLLDSPARRPPCLSGTAVSGLRSAEGSSTANNVVLDSWLDSDDRCHHCSSLAQHWQKRPCCCTSQQSILCFWQLYHQQNRSELLHSPPSGQLLCVSGTAVPHLQSAAESSTASTMVVDS